MTRSKEMRRIEAALTNKDESELKWALGQCELRKRFMKRHSDSLYRLEREIRKALAEISEESR